MSRHIFVLAAMLAATPAFAAGQAFEAGLDPVPFDATNRADVIESIGEAHATLDGNVLTVSGTFSNLQSPAKGAQLRIGLAKGVPGEAIATLSVTPTREGTVTGNITLDAGQVAALRAKSVYVRIDSEKAPDGNLQGWLEATGNN